MTRVLFVCTGNTCRSPIAAAVLRREAEVAGLPVEVGSCGLRTEVAGGPADPRARAVLTEHGYDGEHAVRQFEPGMFSQHDLIIGLDSMHVRILLHYAPDAAAASKVKLLGSFDPAAGAGWDVPDPVGGDISDYQRTLRFVQTAMPGVLAAVRSGP